MASGSTAPLSTSGGNSALFFFGGDDLWSDGVNSHTTWAQLDVKGADQVHQCGLRDTVRDIISGRLNPGTRRHMEDGSGAFLFHVRHHRLRQPQSGAKVDVHQLREFLRCHAERAAQFESSDGVDQDVRRTDIRHDSFYQRCCRGWIGAICDFEMDAVGELFQARFVAVDGYSVNPADCRASAVARPSPAPAPATIAMRLVTVRTFRESSRRSELITACAGKRLS